MINYYEILNVPNFSDDDTIKDSYKSLMLKNHPDKGGDSQKFQQIKEAYDILKDKNNKKEYDNQLIYFLEIMERAEIIQLKPNDAQFTCTQCHGENNINTTSIDSSKENICKCENCSMIYKIIIKD